jgi:16S rRNA (guanine527-N7)-methyltransferase
MQFNPHGKTAQSNAGEGFVCCHVTIQAIEAVILSDEVIPRRDTTEELIDPYKRRIAESHPLGHGDVAVVHNGLRMDTARIAELLRPFTTDDPPSPQVLGQLQRYLDLLLRWNTRVSLTSVREPKEIITRHFGESLFAARVLLGSASGSRALRQGLKPGFENGTNGTAEAVPFHSAYRILADLGAGAGFPGIPIKLFAPELALTLIESHNKKAAFLREVIRALGLDHAEVFCGRAEQWGKTADIVSLRAVEQFARALAVAAELITPDGRLCLLIGARQVPTARDLLGGNWSWQEPLAVPLSAERVILVGSRR